MFWFISLQLKHILAVRCTARRSVFIWVLHLHGEAGFQNASQQPAQGWRLCLAWWLDYKDALKLQRGCIKYLVLEVQQEFCQLWLIWFPVYINFRFPRACKDILSRKPQPQVLNRRWMSIQIAFQQLWDYSAGSGCKWCHFFIGVKKYSLSFMGKCYMTSEVPQSRGLGGSGSISSLVFMYISHLSIPVAECMR